MKPSCSTNSVCSTSHARELIEAAREDTIVIVDLDETLILRNTTEEYLNSIRPRSVGAVLLYALDILKPWNWLPAAVKGEKSRDWIRVMVMTVLFPWTLILWKRRAPGLVVEHGNIALIRELKKSRSRRKILATLGFAPIVAPIIRQLGVNWADVITSSFWLGLRDRSKGKRYLIERTLGPQVLVRALMITDPGEDPDLVRHVATCCCVNWPGASYIPAMSDVYVPFAYIEKVKHSDKRYLRNAILGEDVPFILLASSWISVNFSLHALSTIMLVLSFWCIYETGYYENDRVADDFEGNTAVSNKYKSYKRSMGIILPWGWALAIAMPGLALLQFIQPSSSKLQTFGLSFSYSLMLWFGLLLCMRLTFWCYNYLDKQTRMWFYPLLQFYRYFSCAIITTTNLAGAILLIAQIFARWFSYLVYRHGGGSWPQLPVALIRWVLLLFLMGGIAIGAQRIEEVMSWQAIIIVSYCTFKARRQLWSTVQQVRSIKQPQETETKGL